jgi:hypothetical protein
MQVIKIAVGVALGLFLFLIGCTALVVGGAATNSKSDGVCDKNGCSTQKAAIAKAKEHADDRPGFVFAGVCLDQGADTWWSWSLTATGCPAGEVFVRF